MRTIRAMLAAAVLAIVLSLSVAPAAAQYPPTDPPDSNVATQVLGAQQSNTGSGGSGNLAFTGRSIGSIAALGVLLVVAGGGFYLVGQRRRSETA